MFHVGKYTHINSLVNAVWLIAQRATHKVTHHACVELFNCDEEPCFALLLECHEIRLKAKLKVHVNQRILCRIKAHTLELISHTISESGMHIVYLEG